MTSSHSLRPYQSTLVADIERAWSENPRANVCAVLPTGGGKTVVFSHIMAAEAGTSIAIAHRQELVSQMSLTLAREGVRHRVIAPPNVGRMCAALHMAELGASFFDPGSRRAVAGVDSLIRVDKNDPLLQQVVLWIMDEGHHLLDENKWGEATRLFPHARGLGVTATPSRADGRGLGRHADGLYDELVVGPGMRDLIDAGYLTDYRIFAPPSNLDLSKVNVTATGDFSHKPLVEARKKSTLTGDVVSHYKRLAQGKLGVTFDVDVESAAATAQAYRDAGVPAEVVSSKTPDQLRASILRRFRNREVLQLVNVDLFGEGFDLPAIEVVSMARPTQSFVLYCQQFGRALRIMEGKQSAIIIDHVGNVQRHGLPDARRKWTLDSRERQGRGGPTDVIPVRTCLNPVCAAVYERVLVSCPYCGHEPQPAARGSIELVDGDLVELDGHVLAALRGEAVRIREAVPPLLPISQGLAAVRGAERNHAARRVAQEALEKSLSLWAGWQRHLGRADRETYRRFFFKFGVDMATAMTYGTPAAIDLTSKIMADLAENNVVEKR